MKCCGYIVVVDSTSLYYSGDGCEIPDKALNQFFSGKIDELYLDTCNLEYTGNPHLSISKLAEFIPSEHRGRVFCMHIDESLYANECRISELGFNRILNDYEIKTMEYLPNVEVKMFTKTSLFNYE